MRRRLGAVALGLVMTLLLVVGGGAAFGQGMQERNPIPFETTPVNSPERPPAGNGPDKPVTPGVPEARPGWLDWLARNWGAAALGGFSLFLLYLSADAATAGRLFDWRAGAGLPGGSGSALPGEIITPETSLQRGLRGLFADYGWGSALAGSIVMVGGYAVGGLVRRTDLKVASVSAGRKVAFALDWQFNPFSSEHWQRRKAIGRGLWNFGAGLAHGVAQGFWHVVQDRVATAFPGLFPGWQQRKAALIKSLPGAMWTGVKKDWTTAFGQAGRLITDPDMTDREIAEWAESSAGVLLDASLIFGALEMAAGRANRARLARAFEEAVERSGGSVDDLLRAWEITPAQWNALLDDVGRNGDIQAALRRAGLPHLEYYFVLLQDLGEITFSQGRGKWVGRVSLRPEPILGDVAQRLNGALNNLKGAYFEDLAREHFVTHNPGAQWILDPKGKNVATAGVDGIALMPDGTITVVEMKFREGGVGIDDVTSLLEVTPDGVVFRRAKFLREVKGTNRLSKAQRSSIERAINRRELTITIYGNSLKVGQPAMTANGFPIKWVELPR